MVTGTSVVNLTGCSGRLPKEDVLIEYILHAIARPKDLAGLRIAVTAGPTQEPLDKGDIRAAHGGGTGKGIAHLAGGMVGEVAHRVQRL